MTGLGLPAEHTRVLDVQQDGALPDYDALSAVVITGSHTMVTEQRPWSERLAAWLPGLIARRIPTLGICYGHQLLAYALGGKVADNPHGPEYGAVALILHPATQAAPLLGGLPEPVLAQMSHFQSVLALPDGAIPLAASAKDPHQAFIIAGCVWGVQFHPEFDREIVATYIREFATELQQRGVNPDAQLAGCADTPHGTRILARFGQLAARSMARSARFSAFFGS